MKKKGNWLLILLIIVCGAVFYGYQTLDQMKSDENAPEIYMEIEVPQISVKDPKTVLLEGISAEDRRDGDVTASLVVERVELLDKDGLLQVHYAAFDKAGNVATTQRQAKYTDYESPKFTVNGPLVYRYGTAFDVLKTVGAADVIDGDLQHRIRATALEDSLVEELGTHTVRFQVTNSLGDTATLDIPVEVYDAEQYDAALSLKNYLVYLKKGSSFSPGAYLKEFSFRGKETNLQGNLPRDYTLKTEGKVDTSVPGVYPVEYRVTYTQRNETNPALDQDYVAYSKLIVVVEG